MARIAAFVFIALVASAASGASREIVQMQREVALLGQSVDALQRSVDQRLGAILALVEQTLTRVNQANTASAVMNNGLQERLAKQEASLEEPLQALTTKLERMTAEYMAVRDTMSAVDARLTRLETALERLEETVRIMQAPAPPPAASESGGE